MTRALFLFPNVALFALGFVLGTSVVSAQPASSRRSAERLLEIDSLSQEEAVVFMNRFRNTKLASDFVFDFQLKHIPARGRPTIYGGLLAGTWNEQGPVQRIELAEFEIDSPANRSWLIHSGNDAAVFEPAMGEATSSGSWQKLDDTRAASELLIQGAPITAFDLQLPFVYWESYEWVKSQRVLGRPAHIFDMRPVSPVESASGNIAKVRLYVDADFTALLRADYFDESDEQIRQLKVLSFKEVSGQWIPKVLDFVDTGSREKVRFEVRAAVLNQVVPGSMFDQEGNPETSFDASKLTFERL